MPFSNRLVMAMAAAALVAGACSGDEPPGGGSTIAEIKEGATEVSVISAQLQLLTGSSLFTFGMVTNDGGVITGGAPQVFAARDEDTAALGPFTAEFHEFTAFERFPNEAPRTDLPGFYAAEVKIPQAGNWLLAGVVAEGGSTMVGTAATMVVDGPIAGQVGTEALAVATPVADTEAERREICTREPPDPMHYISLDDALANGKPTVVNFGTPLLCTSRMCGPVVDEALAVYEDVGPDRANFIHVEIYPTRDQSMPAPEFTQWGFQTEPVTLVIDGDGIIRARFEGPVTADLIAESLTPLL